MKRHIFVAAAALLCASAALAEVPATLGGHWVSAPAEAKENTTTITTVYDIDFGSDAAKGDCAFVSTVDFKGQQMGSREMKVNVKCNVKGTAQWMLEGDVLTLSFKPENVTTTIRPEDVVLDIPEAMKVAMAARMNEFMPAITGSIEDAVKKELTSKGIKFDHVDLAGDPAALTVNDDGVTVTFTRQ
ncbi:MAG: hypothetical protein K1V76_05860 [Candidatus Amulumruptor sp.]